MTDLALPLVVMWMLSQRGSGGGGGGRATPPEWPTTRSPPPPLPAFTPYVPVPPAHGTPLPALHKDTLTAPKPKAKAKPANPVTAARQAATQAASHAASNALRSASRSFSLSDLLPSSRGQPSASKPVSDIQAIINRRGGSLKKDGLYGPKTAAAWSALARQLDLPPDISRGGPKVARVVMHTYEVLSVPPIP